MPDYRFERAQLAGPVLHVTLSDLDKSLTFTDVFDRWIHEAEMADCFTRLIADAPYPALFWEMPPLTVERLDQKFECVLVDSSALNNMRCNSKPFSAYFKRTDGIAVFDNLGADAVLLAPVPMPPDAQYTHLARFCRTAPASLSRKFWQRLGEVSLQHIDDAPVWISTAGLGVGWLHARLDSWPKYYSHEPYRTRPENFGDTDA